MFRSWAKGIVPFLEFKPKSHDHRCNTLTTPLFKRIPLVTYTFGQMSPVRKSNIHIYLISNFNYPLQLWMFNNWIMWVKNHRSFFTICQFISEFLYKIIVYSILASNRFDLLAGDFWLNLDISKHCYPTKPGTQQH